MDPIQYKHLQTYLQSGEYPKEFSNEDKRELRRRAPQFHLDDTQVLYYKSKTGLHRVVQQTERTYIICHIHSGIGGAHFGESNTIR